MCIFNTKSVTHHNILFCPKNIEAARCVATENSTAKFLQNISSQTTVHNKNTCFSHKSIDWYYLVAIHNMSCIRH